MRITIYLPDELAKKIDDERRKREKIPTISSLIQEALEFYFSQKKTDLSSKISQRKKFK